MLVLKCLIILFHYECMYNYCIQIIGNFNFINFESSFNIKII